MVDLGLMVGMGGGILGLLVYQYCGTGRVKILGRVDFNFEFPSHDISPNDPLQTVSIKSSVKKNQLFQN